MFKVSQILHSTKLLKNFKQISRELTQTPQALLITQRNGENLVLVNAHIFEELLEKRFREEEHFKA